MFDPRRSRHVGVRGTREGGPGRVFVRNENPEGRVVTESHDDGRR